jgi:hypothetical protein
MSQLKNVDSESNRKILDKTLEAYDKIEETFIKLVGSPDPPKLPITLDRLKETSRRVTSIILSSGRGLQRVAVELAAVWGYQ